MRIKVFKAPTMKEAMANVKAELGDDAVILHTKRYRKGGLMGFRSKEIVEIIAAVEDQPINERVNIVTTQRTELPGRRMDIFPIDEMPSKPEISKSDEVMRIEPKPRPIHTPRSAVTQYQTAGTSESVKKAQQEVDELHRGAKTIKDVVDSMRQQQQRPYDARSIAAREEAEQGLPMELTEVPVYRRLDGQEEQAADIDNGSADVNNADDTIQQNQELQLVKNAPEEIENDADESAKDEEAAAGKQEAEELAAAEDDTVVTEPAEKDDLPLDNAEQITEGEPESEPAAEVDTDNKSDEELQATATEGSENVENDKADPAKEEIAEDKDESIEEATEASEPPPVKKVRRSRNKKETREEHHIQLAADPEDDGKDEQIQQLQHELEQMKAMLSAMKGENKDDQKVNMLMALRHNDVEEHIINDVTSKLAGMEIMADKGSSRAINAMEKYLRKTVRVATGITLLSGRPKIVALIGPTGVGKTTTLAKIAANFVLDKGVSAAMITADTYRISAVEQLKTYSDIIGLPLDIVYSAEALKKAIDKHKGKQLILIDTAGRSQYNEYQMQELCELLSVDKNIEKHLVMSATTKNRDAAEILEHFSVCKPDRIIFTKTDETSCSGIVLNIMHKKKLALSYLTNGQSVPDDIYPASIEKLAELLLR